MPRHCPPMYSDQAPDACAKPPATGPATAAKIIPVRANMAPLLARIGESKTVQRVMALKALAEQRLNPPDHAIPERARAVNGAGNASAGRVVQCKTAVEKAKAASGSNGLGDDLRRGIETLSGLSMAHVTVHRQSNKPARLGALAYAQGAEIHLGPGQDRHLPHEAWHVVQQAQGRVRPTTQLGPIGINDSADLEREADAMGNRAVQQQAALHQDATGLVKPAGRNLPTVQRLVGAGAQPGTDHILPGTASSRGEAARKIAEFINLRARAVPNPAGGILHERTSPVGANNAGNVYVLSNYTAMGNASTLETWSEMTGPGGGYVKRVRITENGVQIMDRVMADAPGTALNIALAADSGAGGAHQYPPVHGVHGGDNAALSIDQADANSADNITKVVGEGARFGWLAKRLASNQVGNASTGIFSITVKIPQCGTLTMNPTFQQLWGAWNSGFGRAYMKDKSAAKSLLQARIRARLRPARDDDAAGAGPLADGAQAAGVVSSLLTAGGDVILVPIPLDGVAGTTILTDFAMTWSADH